MKKSSTTCEPQRNNLISMMTTESIYRYRIGTYILKIATTNADNEKDRNMFADEIADMAGADLRLVNRAINNFVRRTGYRVTLTSLVFNP